MRIHRVTRPGSSSQQQRGDLALSDCFSSRGLQMSWLEEGAVWEASTKPDAHMYMMWPWPCYREAWSPGSLANKQKNKWWAAVLFAEKQSHMCLYLQGFDCCTVVSMILQWRNVSLARHVHPAQRWEAVCLDYWQTQRSSDCTCSKSCFVISLLIYFIHMTWQDEYNLFFQLTQLFYPVPLFRVFPWPPCH